MKIIKMQVFTDGKGSVINRPSEEFPSDTIYTTMANDEYICYQVGDTLPDGIAVDIFSVIRNNS